MNEARGIPFNPQRVGDVSTEAALTYIDSACRMVGWDRAQGLASLKAIFRSGTVPEPALDGRYPGRLLALDIALGLTPLAGAIAARYMPWLGKTFAAATSSGDNIFAGRSRPLARLLWPLYQA